LSNPAVFTSNVQCVRLAAGRRTIKMCCYRSRLVFSCCFKTLTFHKVVQRHTWGVVGSLVTVLLQMISWFWQWNNFWKSVNIWRS